MFSLLLTESYITLHLVLVSLILFRNQVSFKIYQSPRLGFLYLYSFSLFDVSFFFGVGSLNSLSDGFFDSTVDGNLGLPIDIYGNDSSDTFFDKAFIGYQLLFILSWNPWKNDCLVYPYVYLSSDILTGDYKSFFSQSAPIDILAEKFFENLLFLLFLLLYSSYYYYKDRFGSYRFIVDGSSRDLNK